MITLPFSDANFDAVFDKALMYYFENDDGEPICDVVFGKRIESAGAFTDFLKLYCNVGKFFEAIESCNPAFESVRMVKGESVFYAVLWKRDAYALVEGEFDKCIKALSNPKGL